MAVIAILSSMATPKLTAALEQARVARAIGDIKAIELDINTFELTNNRFPTNLAEVSRSTLLDPWGNPYGYNIYTGPGGARKDQFNVPINDDFDLWSMGVNGVTNQALVSAAARDDIVRGNNGGFIGLASNY